MANPKKKLALNLDKLPKLDKLSKLDNFPRDQILFVKSLVESPGEIGQVTPSSRFLAEGMVNNLDLATAKIVVEFGPGTGAVTKAIVKKCGPQTAFFALETNTGMITIWQRRFPNHKIIHDSAENISTHLKANNFEQADYIISSLPFALLPPDLAERILHNAYEALRPDGVFVTYQYLHARVINSAMRLLRKTFSDIDTSVVFRNLPPAFVFRCHKR
ncbi:MAG: methyltransferase domain-containing protein [Acidobacteria bacterium]|nr:methyltransferase domain-containing protein [Acidobacteriota bacterium]